MEHVIQTALADNNGEITLKNWQKAIANDPANLALRQQLVFLLCAFEQYEKADQQLAILQKQQPDPLMNQLRWLVKAAQARQDLFTHRRPPKLINEFDQVAKTQLEYFLADKIEKETNTSALVEDLDKAANQIVVDFPAGQHHGLRDLDDRFNQVMELFSYEGEYYWVSFSYIDAVEVTDSIGLFNFIWSEVKIKFKDESTFSTMVTPAIYPLHDNSPQMALGYQTDWQEASSRTIGIGQKMWLAGEEAIPFRELNEMRLHRA